MKRTVPHAGHQAFRDDLIALLKKHGSDISGAELLALSAHVVGQVLALQDSRTISKPEALELITRNIEQGNQEAIASLCHTEGSA